MAKVPATIRFRAINNQMVGWFTRPPYNFRCIQQKENGDTIYQGFTPGSGRWSGHLIPTIIIFPKGFHLDPPWFLWLNVPPGWHHTLSGHKDFPGSVSPCITILPPMHDKYWNPSIHSISTIFEQIDRMFKGGG